MKTLQVLGPGCTRCAKLKENAEAAVKELGIDAAVEKISDIGEITRLGVMMTPALVIDGQVKIVGRVASVEEIKGYLG